MRVTNRRGVFVTAWPIAMAGLVLGACGGSDAAEPSLSTFDLSSTAFVTRPPETTTTIVAGEADAAGATAGTEQEYVVKAGDFPNRVAQLYGVTTEEIGAYNGWANCTSSGCPEFPFPGGIVKIPPGATNPSAGASTGGDAEPTVIGGEDAQPAPAPEQTETAGDTIPDAGDNCGPGRHVIKAGDVPIRVANQYDVTLEALNQANANVAAYSTFIPGQEIVIPPKSNC